MYSSATATGAAVHEVAAEYPHSTLKGTPTCGRQRGAASYETYVEGRRNLDVQLTSDD